MVLMTAVTDNCDDDYDIYAATAARYDGKRLDVQLTLKKNSNLHISRSIYTIFI